MALKLVDTKALKRGAKAALPVGVGIVTAKAGGALARRAFKSVDDFALSDKGDGWKAGLVDLGAGAVIDVAGLALFAKITTPQKAQDVAPFVFAGTILGAFAVPLGVMVTDKVVGWAEDLFADDKAADVVLAEEVKAKMKMVKAGGRGEVIDMGLGFAGDRRQLAGGVMASRGMTGAINRAGGVMASRGATGAIRRAGGVMGSPGVAGSIRRAR